MDLTIELNEEDSKAFEAQAQAAGLSVSDWLREVARQQAGSPSSGGQEPEAAGSYRPISEVIEEIMADAPAEELAKLPKDGATQIDHYLYGHPKR